MDGQTRQRLIGTILLLLLAAILAPLLLRGPDEVRVALDLDIPEPPPVTPVEPEPVVPESELEETRERISRERGAALEAARSHAEDIEDGGGVPEEPPALSGWSVQVASFSERANAVALEKRMLDAGYNAYWRRVEQEEDTLFRVFVGPELERQDAQELKRRLAMDEAFGQDGLVVPYEP